MPVRRIRGNQRSVTGSITGADGNFIDFESLLERDFLVLTRFRYPAAKIEEQPLKLSYVTALGRKSHYTPDFLVEYDRGPAELVEVKPAKILVENREEFRDRFAAATEFAESKGWQFVIRSEIDIRVPMLRNAHFLIHYQSLKPKPELCARLLQVIKNGPLPVGDLISGAIRDVSERYTAIPQVWHLLATGTLDADLNVPLNQASVVWVQAR